MFEFNRYSYFQLHHTKITICAFQIFFQLQQDDHLQLQNNTEEALMGYKNYITFDPAKFPSVNMSSNVNIIIGGRKCLHWNSIRGYKQLLKHTTWPLYFKGCWMPWKSMDNMPMLEIKIKWWNVPCPIPIFPSWHSQCPNVSLNLSVDNLKMIYGFPKYYPWRNL